MINLKIIVTYVLFLGILISGFGDTVFYAENGTLSNIRIAKQALNGGETKEIFTDDIELPNIDMTVKAYLWDEKIVPAEASFELPGLQ